MHLSETGIIGTFQLSARTDGGTIIGSNIWKHDVTQIANQMDNLADMLTKLIAFDDNPDMVDMVLDRYGLKLDRSES